MSVQIDVAVIGAHSLAGEAVIRVLAERQFPCAQLYALDVADNVNETVEFGAHTLSIKPVDGFDFTQVQLVLNCHSDSEASQPWINEARACDCLVIDTSHSSRLDPQVPLIVPEINGPAMQQTTQGIWASPDSHVVQLLLALEPLRQQYMIERVDVMCLQAVSAMGRAAIDELSQQSIALFNLQQIKSRSFSQQIAFNVLSAARQPYPSQSFSYCAGLVREIKKICPNTTTEFVLSLATVPVFFGHSHNIVLELKDSVDVAEIVDAIKQSPLVKMETKADSASVVTHAAIQDVIHIGPVEPIAEDNNRIMMWTVADNFRRSVAINCVQIGEILVKDYL